ncbi:hypothetical protein FOZ62_007011, partial [Perkinsus olseni]
WTLRNGIENAELRHQVDPYLRDHIDYRSFKAIVIQRHQRQTNDPSREDRPGRRDYSPGKTRVSFVTESPGRQRSRERDYSYPRTRSVSVNSLDESYYSGSEHSGAIANYVAMGKDAVGMRCFRCGGRGHSSRFCTADKPRDYNNRCKICGNTNHKADRCYTKPDRRCNQPGHLAHVCLSNSTKAQTKSTVALRPPTPSARVNSPTNSDSRAVKAEASSEVFMVNYEPSMKGTSVVHYYWGKGSRIFIDADGKLNHVMLHPTDYSDDPKYVTMVAKVESLHHLRLKLTTVAKKEKPLQYLRHRLTTLAKRGSRLEGEAASVPPSSSDYGGQEGEAASVPPSSSDYGGPAGRATPTPTSASDYGGQGG